MSGYILGMYEKEIAEYLGKKKQPAYRAGQIFSRIQKGVEIDEISNIPKELRAELKRDFELGGVKIQSYKDMSQGVRKYLFLLDDCNIIEGVYMPYKHGNTLCVSTQVGCRMDCRFCASTIDGLERNLRADEILGQVLCAIKDNVRGSERPVSNIVLMGMGEPLDNYDETVRFIRLVSDDNGLNIGVRGISVSTCGLPTKIEALADEGLGVTLCVSLHAPSDELRQKLMPVAKSYKLSEVLDAASYYVKKTGRRVIYEYMLIDGVNDSSLCAEELAKLLKRMLCHVNIIPYNMINERDYQTSNAAKLNDFLQVLKNNGISATKRRELGRDIDGACGQLRRSRYANG